MTAAKLIAAASAVAASLALASDAVAAAEARLDVFPERPRVGERVTVQLRTFDFFPDRRPPTIFRESYPMRLNLLGSGEQLELRLVRDPADPYVWRRSYRFPAAGSWVVCGANWQASLEGCVESNLTRRVVRVRPRGAAVDVWHRLQRPFATPSVGAGEACPLAQATGDLAQLGFVGTAWGSGPAYPVLAPDQPLLPYLDPVPRSSLFFGSAWFGQKTLWVIDRRSYRGPILVRGRQLDGPELLRFDRGRTPARELRIGAVEGQRGSFTRIRGPGCYAYQVDGLGFSYTIVFAAEARSLP